MDITRAVAQDIGSLVTFGKKLIKLHSEIDTDYYTFDELNFDTSFGQWLGSQINIPSSLILVARENGQIIGFLSGFVKYLFPWFKIKKVGHISFMFIDETHRRKGAGKNLLEAAKKWFKSQGLSYLELYVNERNTNGLSFWESMGFSDFQKFLRMRI